MQKKKKMMMKREREHVVTRGNENAWEGKECTSNSGSLSKMGWVAEVSSLCLDCQEIINKLKKEGRCVSIHVELAA